jgi:hypothetical protein
VLWHVFQRPLEQVEDLGRFVRMIARVGAGWAGDHADVDRNVPSSAILDLADAESEATVSYTPNAAAESASSYL